MPQDKTVSRPAVEDLLSSKERVRLTLLADSVTHLGANPALILIGVDSDTLGHAFVDFIESRSPLVVKRHDIVNTGMIAGILGKQPQPDAHPLQVLCLFGQQCPDPGDTAACLIFNRDYIPQFGLKIVIIATHQLLNTIIEKAYDFYSISGSTGFYSDLRRAVAADLQPSEPSAAFVSVFAEKQEELNQYRREAEVLPAVLLRKVYAAARAAVDVSLRDEALKLFDEARTLAREQEDKEYLAKILADMADIYRFDPRVEAVKKFHDDAAAIAKEIGSKEIEAAVQLAVGVRHFINGCHTSALKCLKQAMDIVPVLKIKSTAMAYMGVIQNASGDTVEGMRLMKEALAVAEENNDPHDAAWIMSHMGKIYRVTGRLDEGLSITRKALQQARQCRDPKAKALFLIYIGDIYRLRGDLKIALQYHGAALKIVQKGGDSYGEAFAAMAVGLVYKAKGDNEEALTHYEQALKIVAYDIFPPLQHTISDNIGSIYRELGLHKKALAHHEDALYFFRDQVPSMFNRARVSLHMGETHLRMGNRDRALEYLLQARTLAEKSGYAGITAATACGLGHLAQKNGEHQKALNYYRECLECVRECGYLEIEANALCNLGVLYKERKDFDEAAKFFKKARIIAQCAGFQKLVSDIDGHMDAALPMREFREKSFDFQVKKYMRMLKNTFEVDYPGKRYIPLKGETRTVARGFREAAAAPGLKVDPGDAVAHDSLADYVNDWLAESAKNLLVILGEYGTGKTTFSRFYAHQLALPHTGPGDSPVKPDAGTEPAVRDTEKWIPLYLPLREFEKRMDSFVVHQLNKAGITDITYPRFLERLETGEFLVLLDGFDEMTRNIDTVEKARNFDKIRKLVERCPRGKFILTVREEYFRSWEDLGGVFSRLDDDPCDFVFLKPFDDDQVKQYLGSHTDTPDYYWEKIRAIADLHDLSKRPVLLELIVRYLPDIIEQKEKGETMEISASDLYRRCIDDELRRKSEELEFLLPGKYRLEILQKLAVWMFVRNELAVDVMALEEEWQISRFFKTRTSWEFERCLNEFLTFTFLIREGDNRYRMSHKSFRDYLTAREFVKEINKGKPDNFARVQITNEIEAFMTEMGPDKERLLDLVSNARDLSEENQWQGANSARLLLEMDSGILANRDLSGCRLTALTFSKCDLNGTNFEGADLSHCFFDKSILSARLVDVDVTSSFLFLAGCGIKDLTSVKQLKQLIFLDLKNNQLTDVSPLKSLTNLRYLYLSGNPIPDAQIEELKKALPHTEIFF